MVAEVALAAIVPLGLASGAAIFRAGRAEARINGLEAGQERIEKQLAEVRTQFDELMRYLLAGKR